MIPAIVLPFVVSLEIVNPSLEGYSFPSFVGVVRPLQRSQRRNDSAPRTTLRGLRSAPHSQDLGACVPTMRVAFSLSVSTFVFMILSFSGFVAGLRASFPHPHKRKLARTGNRSFRLGLEGTSAEIHARHTRPSYREIESCCDPFLSDRGGCRL